MKPCLITTLFILLTVSLLAGEYTWDSSNYELYPQQSILEARNGVTRREYPNADEVKLAYHVYVRYEEDGSYFQVADLSTKILTEKGRDANRIISSYYASSYSRAKVPFVTITKPDGRIVAIDLAANTKEMVDTEQLNSKIYDWDSKIIQVTIPGLEVGDILRCIYVDETFKPRIPGIFSDFIPLEETVPIKSVHIIIDGPSELPLTNIAIKDPIGMGPTFAETAQEDRIRYEWTAEDIPQFFPEPKMPSAALCCQRLLVSTAANWQMLSRWYYNLCEPRLKTDEAIQRCARELTANCEDFDSRVKALFTFVSQKIRYMGMTAEKTAPGYEPHDVTKTFAEKAGVCRDKAALLVAMLRCIGLEAYPVLIHVGPLRDSEVPMTAFNHAITAVKDPQTDSYILMDSTNETTRDLLPSYLSEKSYLVATARGETLCTTPLTPYTDNLVRIQNNGEVATDGTLTLTSAIEFDGINDNAYRSMLLEMSNTERRNAIVKIISKALPGAQLESLRITPLDLQDISEPLRIGIRCNVPDTLTTVIKSNGKITLASHKPVLMTMPSLSTAMGMVNYVFENATLEKRRFPYRTNFTCGVMENTSITLPEELEISSVPKNSNIECKGISWGHRYTSAPGRINNTNHFYCRNVSLTPNEYQLLRRVKREMATNARRKPILIHASASAMAGMIADEKEKHDYGAEILDKKCIIEVKNPSTVHVTKHLKIRITSYKGIGEWSDMRFEFNPSWEKLTVTDCKVSNGDSTVSVPQTMIRLMDTPYSALAPRYPAGKQLIVAFPGVEVGSILEMTIHKEMSNRSFIGLEFCAREAVPIQKLSYEISVPLGIPLVPQFHPNGLLNHKSDEVLPRFKSSKKEVLYQEKRFYTWSCAKMPAVRIEGNQPPLSWFCPTITVTYGNWTEYAQMLRTYVNAMDWNDPVITELAQSIIKKAPTIPQRINEIRTWVDDHIRLAEPSFNRMPMTAVSTPAVTIRDGYGNSLDRAIVYAALLKATKCPQATMYLASSEKHPDVQRLAATHPTMDNFDACILRLEVDNQEIWLNDQNKYAQLGTCAFDHCLLMDLYSDALQRLTLDEEMASIKQHRMDIEVDAFGKATVTSTSIVTGSDFGRLKKKYSLMTPEERKRHYQSMITALSASAKPVTADLKTDFDHYPGEISFTAEIEDYAIIDGNRCHLAVKCPLPDEILQCRLNERLTPIHWANHTHGEYTIHLKTAPIYQDVLLKPSMFYWQAPEDGSIAWRCRKLSTRKGEPLEFEMSMATDLSPVIIHPRSYSSLREALRRLNHGSNYTFMLQRK